MKFDIVRAWKDEAYRASLSTEEQVLLPENPAGALELSDADLEAIHGADGGSIAGICIGAGSILATNCYSYNCNTQMPAAGAYC